jgi:Fe-S cluster biogenesis protein NfuA
MADDPDVERTGERIESLLEQLRASGDAATVAAAEDLVSALVELYGEGLRRLVAAWPSEQTDRLTADRLVESLLLLHGLHPLDLDQRIERALDGVRPSLGSHAGGVEYLGTDPDGVVHLALQGSCDGCASSVHTVEQAVRAAVESAAPEVAGVDVVGVPARRELPLLTIGRRPGLPAPVAVPLPGAS